MNIKSVNIKNFTVFDDFELDLSSGINIIIGKNGTGKTHLLKGIYTVCDRLNYEAKYTTVYQNLISQLYFDLKYNLDEHLKLFLLKMLFLLNYLH